MNDLFSIISVVNNRDLYSRMKRSLEWQTGSEGIDFFAIDADSEGWNASVALNHGIERTRTEWAVCVHQDVIFPDGWLAAAEEGLKGLSTGVAIVGLVGVRPDGRFAGHVEDPHGHSFWRPLPSRALTVDEHLIMVRKEAGLRFDPQVPGFHCYAADICLSARDRGLKCMVIDAPVVHLSGGKVDASFERASDWLLEKWGASLQHVIPTCTNLLVRPRFSNWPKRNLIRLRRRVSGVFSSPFCNCKRVRYSSI